MFILEITIGASSVQAGEQGSNTAKVKIRDGVIINNEFTRAIKNASSRNSLNEAWNKFFNSFGVHRFQELPNYPDKSDSTKNQLDLCSTMEDLLPNLTKEAFTKFCEMTKKGGPINGKFHAHVRFTYWLKNGCYNDRLKLITPSEISQIKVPKDSLYPAD